ncbi:MAG: hypothetical protein QW117_01110 [Candidatus Pacearchaeota archaeon]
MLGILLQWAGSTSIADVLNDLADLGFFSYVLPFLLIFALVYTILSNLSLFKENKGAALIISLAIGLLSLLYDAVPIFFSKLFPYLGKGLGVLIVALILLGAFVETGSKWQKSLFLIIGGVIFLIVIINAFRDTGYMGYSEFESWWERYGAVTLVAGILIFAIVLVIRKKDEK